MTLMAIPVPPTEGEANGSEKQAMGKLKQHRREWCKGGSVHQIPTECYCVEMKKASVAGRSIEASKDGMHHCTCFITNLFLSWGRLLYVGSTTWISTSLSQVLPDVPYAY